MQTYSANFGSGNWAWPECHRRTAIAVMDDMRVHPYWQRGNRERLGSARVACALCPPFYSC